MNDRIFVLRESIGKITQILTGSGIKVTQRGVTASVTPDAEGRPIVVNLPYIPDNATDELCDAIQGFLDHEVAHVLFTNFKVMNSVGGNKALHSMLNILEDARIEREMSKRYSGSAFNLANTGKFYLDKFVVPKIRDASLAGQTDEIMAVLMPSLIRSMAGQQVFKEFMADKMEHVEEVYEKIKDLAPQIAATSSTADCLEIARIIHKRITGDEGGGGGSGEESGSGKGKSKGGKSSKSKSKPSKSKTGKKSKGEDEPSPDEELSPEEDEEKEGDEDEEGKGPGEESEDEPGEDEEGEDSAGEGAGDEDEEAPGGEGSDDEGEGGEDEEMSASGKENWEDNVEREIDPSRGAAILSALDKESRNGFDSAISSLISDSAIKAAKQSQYLVYTTDMDEIEPLHVGSGFKMTDFTRGIEEPVEHMVGPLQKDLERAISARALSTFSNGHRSGRLHAANLSRLAVGDDRVFRRKIENHSKDVAVELVVDASGSMSGAKIHLASQAAYALSAVLERLHITHEVICFTTGAAMNNDSGFLAEQRKIGRPFTRTEALYMPIIKSFNERLNVETKKRFGWLPNSRLLRNNVDGECIQIAARRLLSRREAGKVMIVLSDGAPCAAGDSGRLHSHLKEVVKEVTDSGINTVGIGIMSDAVRQFYPKNVVIHKVEELPARVMKELRHLLIPS